MQRCDRLKELKEAYLELEDLLVDIDMGRIGSALRVEWLLEHCPDLSEEAIEIWVERVDERLSEEEAIDRLDDRIKWCFELVKRGRDTVSSDLLQGRDRYEELIEAYQELEDLLIHVDMGRIGSALRVRWIIENCPEFASEAMDIFTERLLESITENEAIERLDYIIKECFDRVKRGHDSVGPRQEEGSSS